ncbi:MAG: hypothetical protein HKL85_07745 [Acidimicrobiaceae bacterium]|nr:hypothetical protein [Acidimicrobiaceae bacterium]
MAARTANGYRPELIAQPLEILVVQYPYWTSISRHRLRFNPEVINCTSNAWD